MVGYSRWRAFLLGLLVFHVSAGFCLTVSVTSSKTLVAVNDPQEIVFTDLEPLIAYTQQRLEADKTLTDRDVISFYDALRNHGAPQAGTGESTKVALIVPPTAGATQGILVVKGTFDRAKVLDIISRHYAEHVNEHLDAERQQQLGIGATTQPILEMKTYRFVMPVRERELHIVDVADCTIFASHRKGDTAMLEKTVQVLSGKLPVKPAAARSTQILYSVEPTEAEQEQALAAIDDAFTRYTNGAMNYRRGVARFTGTIKTILARSKVNKAKDAIKDMVRTTLKIDRCFSADRNDKLLTLQMQFQNVETAQSVKASAVKHLVAEMKKPANQGMITAMQNPQITTSGNSVNVQVPMKTEEDQMHAFSVMSTYVARQILGTRVPPVVRRLKVISDDQAALARQIDDRLSVELARTSFFSLGRKFSLGYQKMRVRSDVRRCEDLYVEMTREPKVLQRAVEKLAEVSTRDLDILDKLIESRSKSYPRPMMVPPQVVSEFTMLRAMRRMAVNNAQHLILTAKSPAFQQMAGALVKDTVKKLEKLASAVGASPLFPRGAAPETGMPTVAGSTAVNAAGQVSAKTIDQAIIPEGMTLEKAQKEYQAALQAYTQTAQAGDENKTREAYDLYQVKYAVYQALLEKFNEEEQKKEEALTGR